MSILDRLNRLIRANLNDAGGGSSGSDLASSLDEMENSLREARRRRAEMRRSERQLVESIREARDVVDEWEERAMLALQNGDEDLAREALQVKNEAVRRADELRTELREHRSHMEDIEASLDALEAKLQSHRDRLKRAQDRGGSDRVRKWDRRLEERRPNSSGEASEPATSADETFRTDDTFETFDRMAGKIDAMEAEIEAARELSGNDPDSRRARLERRFRELEGRTRGESKASDDSEQTDQREGRDSLSGLKRRVDRLAELKDKFDDEDGAD